jgi:hypothetical protein
MQLLQLIAEWTICIGVAEKAIIAMYLTSDRSFLTYGPRSSLLTHAVYR